MRKIYILICILCTGCADDSGAPLEHEDRPHIVMTARMESEAAGTRARIDPDGNGFPPVQLPVGIVTVNHTIADPAADPAAYRPGLTQWAGSTVMSRRGYFGGPGLNTTAVTNGEIEYTNDEGTAIQRVFYEDNGTWYFSRVFYPLLEESTGAPISEIVQTPRGAEVSISPLDGSQDVMCSNLAWGNVDNPVMSTDAPGGEIVLSHLFSLLKVQVKVENDRAATQFGAINEIVLRFQPAGVRINMMNLALSPSELQVDYPLVSAPGVMPITVGTSAVDAGYVMAPPATAFRFEAMTARRRWVHANLNFATQIAPSAMSIPGTAYEVVITLMESYEVVVGVQPIGNWYMDSVLD